MKIITRLSAAVVAASLVLLGSAAPAAAATTTVDNATAGRFIASADWGTSAWSTQRYGADYRFATPNTVASDAAWFKASIAAAGAHLVEVWYPADAGYNSATPFMVATTEGTRSVVVDQRANGGRWVSLGTFPLAAGDYNVVGVSRWTSQPGYVVADAVRITSSTGAVSFSLPLPRTALPRSEYDDPHHDYPAIDLPVGTGTPAYAVRAGTVTVIDDSSCGRGINLTGTDGAIYTYCHFSSWSVSNGASVGAGQQIGLTGNTGNSTGPHLHFGIRTGSVRRCPQNFLLAVYDGATPPAASSLPTTGCSYVSLSPEPVIPLG
ncbi:peptidoglycan DD-metalloendopeptidase family protein [Nonomuraea jiangxiensis]|uniref:Murein DD-endopeptidase MepM and murein hydrolase activator NlpD, contain LysM domain n=1 Tax=Nonomuraea jiangxiensis TaxID=633440 RepID=A0A1G9N9C8_9ACTN|nr:peptidoglycan DD-metalloendopeptidase family protein [Nonomuraea jiangxiensis]SDL83079.1 Murein DD-endopeptidase MepM and murein hydrolase activator NlpD, contain LysM domain [Nonomuraea jiangxiensis]